MMTFKRLIIDSLLGALLITVGIHVPQSAQAQTIKTTNICSLMKGKAPKLSPIGLSGSSEVRLDDWTKLGLASNGKNKWVCWTSETSASKNSFTTTPLVVEDLGNMIVAGSFVRGSGVITGQEEATIELFLTIIRQEMPSNALDTNVVTDLKNFLRIAFTQGTDNSLIPVFAESQKVFIFRQERSQGQFELFLNVYR